MALARSHQEADPRQQAAHLRTSAYSLPTAVSRDPTGTPKSRRRLQEQRSRRERFSRHICSSQCRSCQSFEMGQRGFVIYEGLRIFKLQTENVGEVREHMNKLLAIERVGVQC